MGRNACCTILDKNGKCWGAWVHPHEALKRLNEIMPRYDWSVDIYKLIGPRGEIMARREVLGEAVIARRRKEAEDAATKRDIERMKARP